MLSASAIILIWDLVDLRISKVHRAKVRLGPKSGRGQSQARTKVRPGPKSGRGQSQDGAKVRIGAKVRPGPK